ncbi:MAG: hypothetical protein KDN22_24270 [Verrucomicrobiae bacterium]|nr:hypothetical protein [Verrucomicrobiae bacterium]
MKLPLPARGLILTLFLFFSDAHAQEPETVLFRAGAAKRVVTPDPLLPISGGVGAGVPSTQKQGELSVRAVVLERAEANNSTNGMPPTLIAIVTGDFLGFPAALGDKVRAQVKAVPPQNILIAATHAHSGPDCYGFPDSTGKPGANLEYLQSVCDSMAAAINEAVAALQPATLRIATGEAVGRIAFNAYAEQLYDPRCSVIQAGTASDTIFTLVNYAIHPEVLGNDRGITSPDLVGPMTDRLEQSVGGIGMFVNGAQGGMVTADNRDPETGEDIGTWEECQRIGSLLADEALRIIATDTTRDPAPILRCHARRVAFPVESSMMRAIIERSPLGIKMNDDNAIETNINVIELGDARIATIPGEALPNIGYYLKRKMGGGQNLLFGLTNDAFGYILTEVDFDSFKRYRYITRTSLGERTGTILIDTILGLIASEVDQPE